jgi:O-antigen ligase
MATRNQIGLVAVLGVVTFAIELLTRSVSRPLGIGSITLAGAIVFLSRSPVVTGVAIALAVAVLALVLLRRVEPTRRVIWQWITLGGAIALAIAAWAFRSQLITILSGNSELTYRLTLWRGVWELIARNSLLGSGWIGQWRPDIQPFTLFAGQRSPSSALNAYLDVWFQLGLAGIFIFLVLVGLAFVRSWLLAGGRRSIVFAWPALVLVALIVSALAESSMLVEYGWMAFVVCCVKAAEELSWRRAFAAVGSATAV